MCEGREAKYTTFVERLQKQSTVSVYANARNEWVPVKYWEIEHPIKCLCGAPIKKVLLVKNIFNGKEVFVGISCVKELITKAIGETALKDFDRISTNQAIIPNPAIVIYARLEELISEKEYHFLIDMSRGTWEKLTLMQKHWLVQINQKMVSVIKRNKLKEVFWPYYTIYR